MENREKQPVLKVEHLSISFERYDRGMKRRELELVHDLSLAVSAGEIVAVAGASGSGKSLLAHGILGILPGNARMSGSMEFCGQRLDASLQKKLRGREISFIPQSVEYLDPLMKVGKQVAGVCSHKEKRRIQEKMYRVFERYHLNPETADRYPHQLSGGMARRVLIAGAVMHRARLIVADEPTPGLQEELARETFQNFRELAEEGCGILLITHDIDLALQAADRVAMFYAGTILEIAPAGDFRKQGALRHPYSQAFLRAMPRNEFEPVEGTQPYAGNLPEGCLFRDRCPNWDEDCKGSVEMRSWRGGEVRCIHAK